MVAVHQLELLDAELRQPRSYSGVALVAVSLTQVGELLTHGIRFIKSRFSSNAYWTLLAEASLLNSHISLLLPLSSTQNFWNEKCFSHCICFLLFFFFGVFMRLGMNNINSEFNPNDPSRFLMRQTFWFQIIKNQNSK